MVTTRIQVQRLWGPTEPLPDAFSIYTWQARIAYGKLFVPDYGGYVHAFDVNTGEKLWTYFLGDAGYDTPYGHYPIETPMIVADGKVYGSAGHGYSPPLFKGATLMGVDAETGESSMGHTVLWRPYGYRQQQTAT